MLQYKDLTLVDYTKLEPLAYNMGTKAVLLASNGSDNSIYSFTNASLEYDIAVFDYYFEFESEMSGSGIVYLPATPLEGFPNPDYTQNFVYFEPYIEDDRYVGFFVRGDAILGQAITYTYLIRNDYAQNKIFSKQILSDNDRKIQIIDVTKLPSTDFSVVVHVTIRGN